MDEVLLPKFSPPFFLSSVFLIDSPPVSLPFAAWQNGVSLRLGGSLRRLRLPGPERRGGQDESRR